MFRFTLVRYISSLPTTSRERNRVKILDVTNGAPITVLCMIRCSILIGRISNPPATTPKILGQSARFWNAITRDASALSRTTGRSPSPWDASAHSRLSGRKRPLTNKEIRPCSRDASARTRNGGTRPFQSSSWDASARLRLRDASALSLSHYGTEARARFRFQFLTFNLQSGNLPQHVL